MKSIDETVKKRIIELIIGHKAVGKIVIFGSRAENRHRETSDIDIAIFDKNWSDKDVNIVRHNLNEYVKTPLKFDILNFCTLEKDKLKENILKNGVIIYESRKN